MTNDETMAGRWPVAFGHATTKPVNPVTMVCTIVHYAEAEIWMKSSGQLHHVAHCCVGEFLLEVGSHLRNDPAEIVERCDTQLD